VETSDNEGLREAILGAIDESWRGEEMGVVYRSLDRAVDHQLAGIIHEGIEFARLHPDESKADTTSWAWQVIRECTERRWLWACRRGTGSVAGASRWHGRG